MQALVSVSPDGVNTEDPWGQSLGVNMDQDDRRGSTICNDRNQLENNPTLPHL